MPTYPLATLGVTINAAGISAPPLTDIINSLIVSFQAIYGSDVVLIVGSQDYQNISIRATAQNDTNNSIIAEYLGFMPGYAQGVNLSNLVLINGIQREASSASLATVVVGGVVGVVIPAGVVQDQNGFSWSLPANVTIPSAGVVAVDAVCGTQGAISAPPNTITLIVNQQIGWYTATNPAAASPGQPVELDATLRQRQKISTGISAFTPLSAIAAAIANVTGVSRSKVYENDEAVTDANGIPSHSISPVVFGGSSAAIAQTVERKKSPGTGTYGSTSVIVLDPSGVPINIKFFVGVFVPIYISVTIQPLVGYVPSTATTIIAALVAFVNSLPIGVTLYYNWLWSPASLDDDINELGQTYVITAMTVGTAPSPTNTSSVIIPFNQAASCDTPNVVLTTLP